MNLQHDVLKRELILSFCIFFICLISVIIAGLLVKLFFVTILWVLTDEFGLTWNEVLRGVKIGGVGGAILGAGIVLFRLFKVKGF
ncbi:hypothetical protein CKF42_20250 [Pantoea sp. ARC270]|uniref:hypothetical protein n=1 Tax=Pantoea TaxID=53335 RepID=UPI000DA92AB0|nr:MULTISPECIES: hypothetical protein [Pantoea]KAF6661696.1 hypothetical protein HFD92_17220 [Pantoea sp. EKM101V]MDQ1212872.1 hypothetical protein [Pantoea anthophila]PZL84814.1 hypothetical protein CKF42_20250 [Pantoea sp. ARC270]